MSFWSRFANVFRGERLSREIDEELRSHLEEAIENSRDPAEARRALAPRCATAKPAAMSGLFHGLIRSAAMPCSAGDSSAKERPHQPLRFCRSDWHLARARAPSGSSTRCCCAHCR